MIDFQRLRAFCAVARFQSYTRAAEELFMSQPRVHTLVRDLERSLGVKLIEQVGKVSHLTEAGRLLFDQGALILRLVDDTELALRQVKHHERGSLFVGASPACPDRALAEVLGRFRARYPNVELRLIQAPRDVIERQLLHREVDIGVFAGDTEVEELVLEDWFSDELILIAQAQSRGSRSRRREQNGERLPLVQLEESSELRAVCDRWLLAAAIQVEPTLECSTPAAVVEAVAQGLGVGLVPRRFMSDAGPEMRIAVLEVEHSLPRIDYRIAYLGDRELSASGLALLSTIAEVNGPERVE